MADVLFTNDSPLDFIPLAVDHFPLLTKWMNTPHVAQWWSEGKEWINDRAANH